MGHCISAIFENQYHLTVKLQNVIKLTKKESAKIFFTISVPPNICDIDSEIYYEERVLF